MSTNATGDVVDLPPGATNHGDPNLLCVPASWTDLVAFFGTNYLAHAATLISRPGQSLVETIVDTVNALFIPGSGMIRAIRLLLFYVDVHRRTPPLRRLAKAGTLCMVVRREHLRRAINQSPGGDWFSDHFSLAGHPTHVPPMRSVLGTCIIRDRRAFCLVEVSDRVPLREFLPDFDAPLRPDKSGQSSPAPASVESDERRFRNIQVPGQLDVAKILVSILQLTWGISTLYNTRGNQIDLYGYGAFGLTVAPYVLMSFVNLLVSLVLPVHNSMYLVWTRDAKAATETLVEMRSGRRRPAGEFYGMIAAVDDEKLAAWGRNESYGYRILDHPRHLIAYSFFYVLIAIVPLVMVGALTKFRTGGDVHVDRAWILAWLIIGSASSILIRSVTVPIVYHRGVKHLVDYMRGRRHRWRSPQPPRYPDPHLGWLVIALLTLFTLWIPAIGGMIVVGQMLREFGICSRF